MRGWWVLGLAALAGCGDAEVKKAEAPEVEAAPRWAPSEEIDEFTDERRAVLTQSTHAHRGKPRAQFRQLFDRAKHPRAQGKTFARNRSGHLNCKAPTRTGENRDRA